MADKTEAIRHAISEAQKGIVNVQKVLVEANPLAVQIPMYERLGKIVAELRGMLVDAQRLPL